MPFLTSFLLQNSMLRTNSHGIETRVSWSGYVTCSPCLFLLPPRGEACGSTHGPYRVLLADTTP
uniref:Uncharacterized protein n=1 Tax=Triticum urartu TaxID=4572 RepID=A0A8R7TZU6_TRIUA